MSAKFCQLCQRSEETGTTGPLLTERDVCAHLECLLHASGLWCRNSPDLDDLNGFAVEDVKKEVQRGKQLLCHKCKRPGATVGCELKRCRRSYHYPCALEDGAENKHDEEKDTYSLFCPKHKKNSASSSSTPVTPAELKSYCFKCEASKGNSAMEGMSNVQMVTCSKHTNKQTNDDDDDGPSNKVEYGGRKRKLNFSEEKDEQLDNGGKRKSRETIDSDSDHCEELALQLSSDTEVMSGSSTGEKLQCDAQTQYEGETIIDPVKCRICATELSYLNRSTSSLYRHFRALHDRDPISASVSKSVSRKQAMDQAVLNMVTGEWPLSIVEDEGFRELLHLLEPSYIVPTTKALESMMGHKLVEENEMTDSELPNGVVHVKVENLLAPLEFSPPDSPVTFFKEEPLDEYEEEEEEVMESRSTDKREKAVPAEESRNPRVRLHQQFLSSHRKKDSKGQAASGAAKQQGDGYVESSQYDSIIPSDVDSDSLLAPVRTRDGLVGRSASQVGSSEAPETENGVSSVEQRSRTQSRLTEPVDMPEYYQYAATGLFSSPVSPTPFESNGSAAIMDSASFWRSCNTAGCTEDFFSDLVSQMTRLSGRIQSDQASQEDYDVAMKVMEASGRIAVLVGNKQKELEEKQAELLRAQAALKTLSAAVRR